MLSTAEDLVRACSSQGGTTIEEIKECLKEHPEFANASAVVAPAANNRFSLHRGRSTPITALKAAVHAKSPQKVRVLLENGSDIEARLDYDGNTALILASRGYQCSLEVVETLLQFGANVNAAGDSSSTPLMGACLDGHVEIVRLLLQNGAQVDTRSCHDRTALIIHCRGIRCETEIVSLLIQEGADVNAADEEGFTPLMGACCNGNLEVASLLLQHGADVHARDYDNCTPLLGVCQDPNNTDLMRLLLEKGADPNVQRGCGCTAFSAIIGLATLEQIRLLLDHGADINSGCHCDGKPLQNAIKNCSWQIAQFLLEQGADSDRCLFLAVKNGAHQQLLMELLERGAAINETNFQGDSVLSTAAITRKDVGLVNFLIDQGADVNARGADHGKCDPKYSSTPWLKLLSASDANEEIVRLFLQAGANVRDKDPQGNTALMLAKSVAILQLIREHDQASIAEMINASNVEGDTALIHHAKQDAKAYNAYPSTAVIEELLKVSTIDKNVSNNNKDTALIVAIQKRRVDVVQLLLNSGGVKADGNETAPLCHAVAGSTCLFPVLPPLRLQGTMSIKQSRFLGEDGNSLTMDGTWGVDNGEITEDNITGRHRFWISRKLENGDPEQLERLEQMAGIFEAGISVQTGRGGSMGCSEGKLQLTFSKCAEDHGAMGFIVYNVKGEGGTSVYGLMNIDGTATLEPTDSGGVSVKVMLTKTYQPGTGNDHRSIQSLCDTLCGSMKAAGGKENESKQTQQMAVHKDYMLIVNALCEHGADVNIKGHNGNTPLMIACHEHGDAVDMVELLVNKGASIYMQNDEGHSALSLANSQGALSTVYFLLLNGGCTALK